MPIRLLKIAFVVSIALMCLFYAAQNIVNLEACYQAFAYLLGAADHQVYRHSVVPAVENPLLVWLALCVVIALEVAAGALAAKGAWDLWQARRASAEVFNGQKTYALVGCGPVKR